MRTSTLLGLLVLLMGSSIFAQTKGNTPTVGGGNGSTPVTASSPPTVIDANGSTVGTYAPSGFLLVRYNNVAVGIPISTRYTAQQSADKYYYPAMVRYYYPTNDCTGIPIIPTGPTVTANSWPFNSGLRPFAWVVDSIGNPTMYIAASGPSTQQTYNSFGVPGGCNIMSGMVDGYSLGQTVTPPPAPLTVQ